MKAVKSGTAIHLIQLTDSHLYGEPDAQLLKMDTLDSFQRVLSLIDTDGRPVDLILATGDIAQDASPAAYRRFADSLHRFAAPWHWVPGNHDRAAVMRRLEQESPFQDAGRKRIIAGNWQVLMLDSSVAGEVHGLLGESEMRFLDESLSEAGADQPIQHTMVCLHHNPHPGSAAWMQGIGLHNAPAFLAVLGRHASVRAVCYGHIHQSLDYQSDGIRFLCTPSTCIQFKPGATDFTLDERAPGYRWIELHEDGRLESGVERLKDFDVAVDHDSDGY